MGTSSQQPNKPRLAGRAGSRSVCAAFLLIAVGLSSALSLAGSDTTPVGTQTRHTTAPDTSPKNAGGMNLSRCIDCHSFDQLFSHPVGVTPPASMSVPANLPLTNGRVTCVTCHADSIVDHAVDRSTGRQADIGQHDMIETGISLCAQCHDASSTSAQDLHALTIGRAHLPQSSLAKNASFSPGSPSMEWLDSESDLCMTCHDGALASSSGTDSGMRLGSSILATRPSEHPIGSYEYSDHLNPDGELTPLSMLDDRIRLFGNQVGCGSCHSMYSNERELLVMSNEGSQLCLSCHEY